MNKYKLLKKLNLCYNPSFAPQKNQKELENILNKHGFTIDNQNYDLAIAIGGDGTFIKMVRDLNFDNNICYVGINTGTLGFLQEINPEEIENFVIKLKHGNYKTEEIGLQQTKITTTENTYNCYSLNEIIIRDYKFKTAHLTVKVDETYQDVIHVSTKVGDKTIKFLRMNDFDYTKK